MSLTPSGSQTVGPFFNFCLTANPKLGTLARDGAEGERIRLEFRVTDGDGTPTPSDSMIELWQADSRGRYGEADANFCGFGRLETDDNGECVFETVKPGCVPGNDGGIQAPHINVVFFARGLLMHLHTRVYFAGDAANPGDAVLQMVPEARRSTLMAQPVEGRPGAWRMEIRLQGEAETVFFDV
jgi:protocatechuate 3,4-dioxygenase, alpha subunit